ncbi:hypothetical protein IV471_04360 [Enterococcus gallinarum]|uniref:hypothetical protein n=1 Tax=Enterococcus gallinarum TaxID=1353 RepID=UPI001E385A7D|nr:hypothetical protein [Enterococcus gallinarum]MCD5184516.1 hypothetical protein [Enterococcus gallinarum]MDT2730255.1 hypothetical protein [Enterococcus gallinarum]
MENSLVAAYIAGGVTVLCSLLSLGFQGYSFFQSKRLEQKKINAELVSKARIEWINKVRLQSAELIANTEKWRSVESLIRRIEDGKIDNTDGERTEYINKLYTDKTNEIDELSLKIIAQTNVLTLYFSNNEENKEILETLSKIKESIFNYKGNWVENNFDVARLHVNTNRIYQNKFSDSIRIYLKQEWDKAKNAE